MTAQSHSGATAPGGVHACLRTHQDRNVSRFTQQSASLQQSLAVSASTSKTFEAFAAHIPFFFGSRKANLRQSAVEHLHQEQVLRLLEGRAELVSACAALRSQPLFVARRCRQWLMLPCHFNHFGSLLAWSDWPVSSPRRCQKAEHLFKLRLASNSRSAAVRCPLGPSESERSPQAPDHVSNEHIACNLNKAPMGSRVYDHFTNQRRY